MFGWVKMLVSAFDRMFKAGLMAMLRRCKLALGF